MDQIPSPTEYYEEDSFVGEYDKREGWVNTGTSQMEGEFVDSGSLSRISLEPGTVAATAQHQGEITEAIRSYETLKSNLEEIVNNQTDNIVELHGTCERLKCILNEWPLVRDQTIERYHEVLEDIKSIFEKQGKVNKVLEYTVKAYDEHIVCFWNAKKNFEVVIKRSLQRVAALQVDLRELPLKGEGILKATQKRTDDKTALCSKLKERLQKLSQSAAAIAEMNAKFQNEFERANQLNNELLKSEFDFATAEQRYETLKGLIVQGGETFNKQIEDLKKQESESLEKLETLGQKIILAERESQRLRDAEIELNQNLTSREDQLSLLKKGVDLRTEENKSLSSQHEMLERQLLENAKELSNLENCAAAVAADKVKVATLERDIESLQHQELGLSERCQRLSEEIASVVGLVTVHESEADTLAYEYEDLLTRVSSAQESYHQKRADAERKQKSTIDRITDEQVELMQMNQRLMRTCGNVDQKQKQLAELQNQSSLLQNQIREKNEKEALRARQMSEITEEIEERKVLLGMLDDDKRQAMDVKELEKALNSRRQQAIRTKEECAKTLDILKKENCEEASSIMKEIEDLKLDYLIDLKNQDDQIKNLQREHDSLKELLTLYQDQESDAANQLEIYECENGLLRTVLQWAGHEEPAEPWVSSTSETNAFALTSPMRDVDPDFDTVNIRTARILTDDDPRETS